MAEFREDPEHGWVDDQGRPLADPDPLTQRLTTGLRLWEQLKQVDSDGKALLAISGLEDEDLRAIVTHLAFHWHQTTKTPDEYGAWFEKKAPE